MRAVEVGDAAVGPGVKLVAEDDRRVKISFAPLGLRRCRATSRKCMKRAVAAP